MALADQARDPAAGGGMATLDARSGCAFGSLRVGARRDDVRTSSNEVGAAAPTIAGPPCPVAAR